MPLLALVATGSAALLAPAKAQGAEEAGKRTAAMRQALKDVHGSLQVYQSRVERLAAKYSAKKQEGPSVYRLQSRINDGLVFFQLGEYERASFLLLEVVQDQLNQGYVGYKDALFYLAESLYQLRNPIAATQYYQLVVEKGIRQYRKDALLRLVEICFVTGQLGSLDRYFAQLASEPGATSDPQILYVHAKSLFFRHIYDQALQEFAGIGRGTPYFHRARYFLGTIQVLEGRYQDAMASFQQVAAEPASDQTGKAAEVEQVKELAHLALGRLYFEQDQLAEAVTEYQLVPRESANFDRALYESCWTFIRKAEHQAALRALDILLLAAPESTLAPEAALLKGNLQLKLNKYAEAQSTFQEIVDRFGPVREQLGQLMAEHADPETYFQQLLGRNMSRFDVRTVVPPLAGIWVKEEESVGDVLAVVQQVDGAAHDLAAATELVGQLEDALTSENRIEIFPEYNQAWKTMLESESALLALKQRLIEEERRLIWNHASTGERAQYQAIADQRTALERRFREIPATEEGLAKREAKVEGQLEELQLRAFRLGIEIDALKAQLVAMDKWIRDTSSRRPNPAGEERVRAAVLEQQAELKGLEEEMSALRREIIRRKGSVGVADAIGSAEAELKQRYDRTLGEEARLLQTLRQRLPPEEQRLLDEEDELRRRIARLEATIRDFYTAVRQLVDEKVRELREQVLEEKRAVARYGRQVEGYQGMGENLAGRVISASLKDVQGKFRSLVLQADVGVIDVAWQKKEEKSKAYVDLVQERKAELDSLEGDFKTVLEEKL